MNISVDVEINSPKAKVWKAITDIANCTDMISAIIELKILEHPDEGLVGLKWSETRKIFGKEATETMWITDCKEGDYYATRAENHGAVYISKLVVSEKAAGTLLTMSFTSTSDSVFVKLISAVMGIFIKKSMVKIIKTDLLDIKRFVEKS